MSRTEQLLENIACAIEAQSGAMATAFRELRRSKVIEAASFKFNANGVIERNYPIPYNSVTVISQSSAKVIGANQPNAGAAPSEGQGTIYVGPLGFGTYNIAGHSLTLYGTPGDYVTIIVDACTQQPAAAAGAVAIAGTATVSGTVTSVLGATSDLYSEAAQSRTTNGNTANMTWPSTNTDAYVAINLTGFAGGTNVQISLDQQDANGIWQSLANSGLLTAVGTKNFTVGQFGGNHAVLRSGQPWRLSWTVTGTFTTLTFQLAVTGR